MKYKILKMMRENDGYISGEEIADKFNVSRTTVWKNIIKLKEWGYEIDSVTNKGYLLKNDFDILNEYEAVEGLNTKYIGQKCIFENETGSTNDDAKCLAGKDAENGTVVLSQKQTKGKGRLGREWTAPEKGLYFSIILKPDILPYEAMQITLLMGIAAAKGIKRISGIDAKIKWPNDIIINGKKAVGILTEMSAEMERIRYIVVGTGINVNNEKFSKEIEYKATSIYNETGKRYSRAEIYKAVLEEFELLYDKYLEKSSFSFAADEYESLCITVGLRIKVIFKDNEIIGTAEKIGENGELIIRKDNGEVISVSSGEVSIRRVDGIYI